MGIRKRAATLRISSLTGATLGFTSRTLGEVQRQWHSGVELDYSKILRAGTIEAGVMGLAARR